MVCSAEDDDDDEDDDEKKCNYVRNLTKALLFS